MGVLNDLPTKLANQPIRLVFDIGANVGQSALELAEAYPDAQIECFEPIESAYLELEVATDGLERVTAHKLAFGAKAGQATMTDASPSTANRLVDATPTAAGRRRVAPGHQRVEVAAGDEYCASVGIEHVDFVKIDTVGHDLEVLRGFHGMLGNGGVDVLQVEVGMYPGNRRQVPFDRFRGYLEPLGYHLLGVYGQSRGYRGLPVLARADLVFISAASIERDTVAK